MPRIQTADITALIRERFQIKGAGSIDTLAPEIVAVVSVDPLLQFNALEADIQTLAVTSGAANTTATGSFSLQRPGLLQAISITTSLAQQPNVDWLQIRTDDPAGAGQVHLFHATGANALVPAGDLAIYPNEISNQLPLFIRGTWDIDIVLRTNAGGAATATLRAYTLVEQIR